MSEDKQPFYERSLDYAAPDDTNVPDRTEIVVQRDILYGDDGDLAAALDIYKPGGEAPSGGFPVVLLLHGGPLPDMAERPWPKSWRVFQDYGTLLAANGIAAVVINHRYIGYEGLLQAMKDALQARQFLIERGPEYNLNGATIAVWAFSGAGMLLSAFLQPQTVDDLNSVVAFYPMLDLTHVQQAQELYSEEELITLSPLSLMESLPDSLPLLFVRAGLDRPGLNRALDTFVKQALYHNLYLEVHNLPQAGHGFDMLETSEAGRQAVRRALDFVKSRLASGSADG